MQTYETSQIFLGVSSIAKCIIGEISYAANRDDLAVLIVGASGTGKDVIANQIHAQSGRKDKKFLAIDCGAISPALFESEIFGHVKGAFTGATQGKVGLAKLADGGTLFLDEVGNLSKDHQSKVLRFLQDRQFLPVGSTKPEKSTARIIAATNDESALRPDIKARLGERIIRVPEIKNRPEDIVALTRYFINRAKIKEDPRSKYLIYSWEFPDNIRGLQTLAKNSDDYFYIRKKMLWSILETEKLKPDPEFTERSTTDIKETIERRRWMQYVKLRKTTNYPDADFNDIEDWLCPIYSIDGIQDKAVLSGAVPDFHEIEEQLNPIFYTDNLLNIKECRQIVKAYEAYILQRYSAVSKEKTRRIAPIRRELLTSEGFKREFGIGVDDISKNEDIGFYVRNLHFHFLGSYNQLTGRPGANV